MKQFIKSKIRNLVTGGEFPLIHAMEPVYQRLVERDLERFGIENRFYPVAGAANYALFYLLVRTISELPIKTVLELGAGESSKLLNALAGAGKLAANITTLEHDEGWAKHISSQVSHQIVLTALTNKNIDGVSFVGYDFGQAPSNIDLLIVDGPPAATEANKFARLGVLELIHRLDPAGFVVILDDTHREGEILLAEKFDAALRRNRMGFKRGQIITSKRQIVFAAGVFERAAYF
jgi:hypothetical protein